MSGNIVERGFSVYLNGEVQGAINLANQGISDASTADAKAVSAQSDATQAISDASSAQASADTADGKAVSAQSDATQALSDASNAQSSADTADVKAVSAQTDATQAISDASSAQASADTADGKAVAVDTKATNLNLSRNMDIEALLQELVIDVTVPDGAFIMGDDSGYYAWDSGSSEYRVTAYASGEALDESDAIASATQFEMIAKGSSGLYMLLEDDGGSLYVVNHTTGTREPLDDVIDGTGNDRASASSSAFESAKNPFNYLVRYCYAPINLSHYQSGNDIYSVHLRAIDGNGDPKLWLYKDTTANDKLVSSAMSNVEERRLYVHEIV